MSSHGGDGRAAILSTGTTPGVVRGRRWLLLVFIGVAAACQEDDTPSDPADPGDLVRMARCKRPLESAPYCRSPSETREMLRQLYTVSFADYPCKGMGDARRLKLSGSDGQGSVTCLFDAATGQLVGARQSSDSEEFCDQSSRSVTYGENPDDCALYPGQSCPPFDFVRGPPYECVLTEP